MYLEGTDRVEDFVYYSKMWEKLAGKYGKINSAYGARVNGSRLEYAINQLITNPDTKNAVVMLRDDRDIALGLKDRCCTLYWHFYIKDNKLNMRTCMRSSDFWLGVPYDVFCFTRYMQYVLFRVNQERETPLQLGVYEHEMLNVHVYEKHWDKLQKAATLDYKFDDSKVYEFPEYDERVDKQRLDYIEWERYLRAADDDTKQQAALVMLRDKKFRPFWETLGSMIVNKTTNASADKAIVNFFNIAKEEAKQSACIDRKVGCVLVADGHIVSQGHNTPTNCNQKCDDKEHRVCEVTHAEINALRNIRVKDVKPTTAYVTLYPCLPCRKALAEAGITDIHVIGFSHKGAGGDQTVKLYDPEYEEV